MAKKNIFALDLGTTKFCIASLIDRHGQDARLQIVETAAKGMRRGMLSDFEQAASALNRLIDQAERRLEVDIREVVVGVAGSHLRGQVVEQSLDLQGDVVQESHIQKLSEKADQCQSNDYREVLHCIPIHYRLDDREPVQTPHGFSAKKISGKFFVIDADRSYLKDVVRLCNQVGLEVKHLFSEPFASASVTVDDQHKDRGVALADIGGGTTDGLVFQNGRPVDVFTINIAGIMMTKDLAVGLNIEEALAETLKVENGLGIGKSSIDRVERNIYGQETRICSKSIARILSARTLELGGFLAESLKHYRGQLGGGVLLTGGGAQVHGLDLFLSERFGVQVKNIDPQLNLKQQTFDQYTSRYATVIGLLNLELCRLQSIQNMKSHFWAKKYINHFVNWIRELS